MKKQNSNYFSKINDSKSVELMFNYYDSFQFKEAYELALKLAEKDNGCAYNVLGNLYALGKIVNLDLSKAVEWYKKSCDKQWPPAFYNLGWYFYNGIEVEKDLIKAFNLYKKAADAKKDYAQYKIGIFYTYGIGTERNIKLAMKYISRSSKQGYQNANEFISALKIAINPKLELQTEDSLILKDIGFSPNIIKDFISSIFGGEASSRMDLKTLSVNVLKTTLHKDLGEILDIKLAILNQWSPFLNNIYASVEKTKIINYVIDIAAFLHLITSLVIYLNCEAPPDEINLPMISIMLSAGVSDTKSDLDRLFNMLEEKNNSHPALLHYKWYKILSDDKYINIIELCQKSIAPLGTIDNFLKFIKCTEDVVSLISLLNDSIMLGNMSIESKNVLQYTIESFIYENAKDVSVSIIKNRLLSLEASASSDSSPSQLEIKSYNYFQSLTLEKRYGILKEIETLLGFFEVY